MSSTSTPHSERKLLRRRNPLAFTSPHLNFQRRQSGLAHRPCHRQILKRKNSVLRVRLFQFFYRYFVLTIALSERMSKRKKAAEAAKDLDVVDSSVGKV